MHSVVGNRILYFVTICSVICHDIPPNTLKYGGPAHLKPPIVHEGHPSPYQPQIINAYQPTTNHHKPSHGGHQHPQYQIPPHGYHKPSIHNKPSTLHEVPDHWPIKYESSKFPTFDLDDLKPYLDDQSNITDDQINLIYTLLHPYWTNWKPSTAINCPPPYYEVGEMCLVAFCPFPTNLGWDSSRLFCYGALGGDLAIFNDANQFTDALNYIRNVDKKNRCSYWLGGTDILYEGDWRWTSRQKMPMGAPFWGKSGKYDEPSGQTSQNYAYLSNKDNYLIHDVNEDAAEKLNIVPLCRLNPERYLNTQKHHPPLLQYVKDKIHNDPHAKASDFPHSHTYKPSKVPPKNNVAHYFQNPVPDFPPTHSKPSQYVLQHDGKLSGYPFDYPHGYTLTHRPHNHGYLNPVSQYFTHILKNFTDYLQQYGPQGSGQYGHTYPTTLKPYETTSHYGSSTDSPYSTENPYKTTYGYSTDRYATGYYYTTKKQYVTPYISTYKPPYTANTTPSPHYTTGSNYQSTSSYGSGHPYPHPSTSSPYQSTPDYENGYPDPHPAPHPHPSPHPQPHPQPNPQPNPHPYPQPNPHPYPQPNPHPYPQPNPHPGPDLFPHPLPHPGTYPYPGSHPKPHPHPHITDKPYTEGSIGNPYGSSVPHQGGGNCYYPEGIDSADGLGQNSGCDTYIPKPGGATDDDGIPRTRFNDD